MVIDTSALLALYFKEPEAEAIAEELNRRQTSLIMSTVNLAETLILLRDRIPQDYSKLEAILLSSSIEFVPPSKRQAQSAAAARLRFPLNLGDCFAYALAAERDVPLLTLDQDFLKTDITVILPKAGAR